MQFNLKIYRQSGPDNEGSFFDYHIDDVLADMSFFEMLDKPKKAKIKNRGGSLDASKSLILLRKRSILAAQRARLSQFPQIKKGTVSIEGERMNNTCIFSDLIIATDTIRIYNIHLASNWFDKSDLAFIENPEMSKDAIKKGVLSIAKRLKTSFKKRALQVGVIKKHMQNAPYPIIVCGDFNDTPNSFSYQKIVSGLNDSFLEKGSGFGSTFLGKIPFLRIDYILHSPNVKIQSFTTHKAKLSDHKAIESSLAM